MTSAALRLDERSHTYWLGRRRLESVGALVKRVTPKFDAQATAARMERQHKGKASELLAQWAKKRDKACDSGHKLHEAIDITLHRHMRQDDPRPPVTPQETPLFLAWLKWWEAASGFMVPLATECRVCDEELGYAGTFDALFASTKTSKHHPFDWKQNERFDTRSRYREFMLPPFQDLESCHFVQYSLQVSLYAIALERTGQACGDGWLVHVTPAGATPHRALDLRARALAWVKGLNLSAGRVDAAASGADKRECGSDAESAGASHNPLTSEPLELSTKGKAA